MKQIITNVQLTEGLRNMIIENGRITALTETDKINNDITEAKVWDAQGHHYLPTMADMHCHLDKHFLGESWHSLQPFTTLENHLLYEKELLAGLQGDVITRARLLLDSMLEHGTTRIRTHVDIDPQIGLRNLEAVLQVKEEYRDRMTFEIVAFPQQGLLRSNSTSIIKEALRNGADFVGGVDPTNLDQNMEGSLHTMFELASEFNKGIDLHLHDGDNVGLQTIMKVTELTKAAGLQGRSSVSHAYCLGGVSESLAAPVLEALREADVAIISSVPLDRPMPRGQQLLEAGVTFKLGSDNIRDAWSPFGNGDMLQRASRLAEKEGWIQDSQLLQTYSLVTEGKLSPSVGDIADFMLIKALNPQHAMASSPIREAVFAQGRLVAGRRYTQS